MTFISKYAFIFSIMSVFTISSAQAKTDASTEIQYLLSFIGQSDCVFIRNGSEYDAEEARHHIERKYNYIKSDLNSADEFIDQAASKSSFSGNPYKVKCGDQNLSTKQWLQTALIKFRSLN